MNSEFLSILRCPNTGQRLILIDGDDNVTKNMSSSKELLLENEDRQHKYPIRNGVARFVAQSNYADNFGMQWNHFAKTQLDSHSGHLISAERFWKATGWHPSDLDGKWILDIGCGSGRFAEIALSAGALVVALDYSSAVDACWANLKHYSNLYVVQGDIYSLPFALESFDFVYSLGVLQHTPDVAKAFACLPPVVKPGGRLCVDYYEKSKKSYLLPKYWLRPITKRINQQQLFSLLQVVVPVLLSVSRGLGRVPLIGKLLKRTVPVANYEGVYPLSEPQLQEWALLDTFDWLAPAYDNPQSWTTVQTWMSQAGLIEIEVLKPGHLVSRGKKPF